MLACTTGIPERDWLDGDERALWTAMEWLAQQGGESGGGRVVESG